MFVKLHSLVANCVCSIAPTPVGKRSQKPATDWLVAYNPSNRISDQKLQCGYNVPLYGGR